MKNGFFHGYDRLVLLVILLQSLGGLIISVVVKYTNSVVKGFATSASIIISCLLSNYIIGDFQLSKVFCLGASIVSLSAAGYSFLSVRKAVAVVSPQTVRTASIDKGDEKEAAATAVAILSQYSPAVASIESTRTGRFLAREEEEFKLFSSTPVTNTAAAKEIGFNK